MIRKLIAMLMVLGFMLGAQAATETVNGITWTYSVYDGKASIGTGMTLTPAISSSTSGAITVPSTLGGYPVTSIGAYAFCDCFSLTSVTIPDCVTSIGECAFDNCTSLTSVTIPDSMASIGEFAFSGCSSLMSVTIPEGVTSVGDHAFNGCSLLETIQMPNSITNFGANVFSECFSLRSVTTPKYLGSLKMRNIFPSYEIITNVVVLDGVTKIMDYTFSDCRSLVSVKLPDSVTSIGECAFENCESLENVVIPNSVTSIGYCAFRGCCSLEHISLPSGIDRLEYDLFSCCSSLQFIDIPHGVTCICDNVFAGCTSLQHVYIPEGVECIGGQAFCDCSSLESISIPNSVTNIGNRAFEMCDHRLYNVDVIPGVKIVDGWVVGYTEDIPGNLHLKGIRGIAEDAFQNCDSLLKVTISGEVKHIPNYAFHNCESLVSVVIEDGVEGIGCGSFNDCGSLVNLSLPDSIKHIGEWAFGACKGLMDENGFLIVGGVLFGYYGNAKEVVIPNGVTRIESGVFWSDNITRISIPDSVTSIGDYALDCSFLTDVTLPDSVVYMGNNVFGGGSSVSSPIYMKLNAEMYRTALKNIAGDSSSGNSSGGNTGVSAMDVRYDLANEPKDRGIANITVSGDTAIDSFVLSDGKVFDAVLRIANISDSAVKLTLPSGYAYETMKGAKPLIIPPNSRNILTLTRVTDGIFLVTREELESVQ